MSLQTSCLTLRSRLALQSGAAAQALALAQQALASARSEHSGDAIKDRYAVASASRLVGDVRLKTGDAQGAKAAWQAGLAVLPPNVTERPWEMQERADLLRRLDRGGESALYRATAFGDRIPQHHIRGSCYGQPMEKVRRRDPGVGKPAEISIQPTGSDPLPTSNGALVFDNQKHDGFDIDFTFTDSTNSGYLWPPNNLKVGGLVEGGYQRRMSRKPEHRSVSRNGRRQVLHGPVR